MLRSTGSMKCPICKEEKSYEWMDGYYTCTECGTHSQDTRDETEEGEGFTRRTLISSPAPERKSGDETKQVSTWTTTEAYNIILYKQVAALIKLGASEKLKKVVLYIWSQYLEKCEVAFRKNNKKVPCVSAFAKNRDIKVLYGNKIIERKKKYFKPKHIKKKSKTSKKKFTAVKSDLDTSDSRECESSNIDDDDNDISIATTAEQSTSEDDSSSDQEIKKVGYSSHAKKIKKQIDPKALKNVNAVTKEYCVDHMTLSKTLCFCYLGLLYTEDQLLLSDVLRFVHEGRIPYLNATDYLPSWMKLQCDDYSCFTMSTIPDVWKISLMSAKIFDFLKLPKFRHRPLMLIIVRFIKDLNLPDKIVPVIKILIDKSERQVWYETKKQSETQYFPIPLYEVQAMAFIIAAMKVIFVLDGKYELDHSEVMTKINILLQENKMFVWNKWRQQTSLKEYLFMKPGILHTDISLFDSLSAAQIISKYPYTRLRLDEDHKKGIFALSTARNRIKNIFTDLNPFSDEIYQPAPTSFPLKQQLTYLMTEWKNLPMYKNTKEIDFSFLSEDFSATHLFYKSDDFCTESTQNLIKLLLSSLYESAEILTLSNAASNYQNILRTSSKYWFKNFPQKVMAHTNLLWLEALPPPFRWLLKFLCKYIKIGCKEMYCELLNIEKQVFIHVKHAKC